MKKYDYHKFSLIDDLNNDAIIGSVKNVKAWAKAWALELAQEDVLKYANAIIGISIFTKEMDLAKLHSNDIIRVKFNYDGDLTFEIVA